MSLVGRLVRDDDSSQPYGVLPEIRRDLRELGELLVGGRLGGGKGESGAVVWDEGWCVGVENEGILFVSISTPSF